MFSWESSVNIYTVLLFCITYLSRNDGYTTDAVIVVLKIYFYVAIYALGENKTRHIPHLQSTRRFGKSYYILLVHN